MNKTGFVWHERYIWPNLETYDEQFSSTYPTQPFIHYPEPDTKYRFKNLLNATGVIHDLITFPPSPISDEDLLLVHPQAYLDSLNSLNSPQYDLDDSPLNDDALTIARLSAGSAITAISAICEKKVQNAYALIRPQEQPTEYKAGIGLGGIFNDAALAARYAQKHYGMKKIAFIDWDVHHNSATQEIFWQDSDILTISIHQDTYYLQDSGYADKIGEGEGIGRNINIPLPPDFGFGTYEYVFSKIIIPALRAFKPDLIIIPSGFDAGTEDPLHMMVHSEGYRKLTKNIMKIADELCDGRLFVTNEVNNNDITVPFFGLAVIETLLGQRYTIFNSTQEAFEKLNGQSLQTHQKQMIDKLHGFLKNVSGSLLV